jgi:hypothetical protein
MTNLYLVPARKFSTVTTLSDANVASYDAGDLISSQVDLDRAPGKAAEFGAASKYVVGSRGASVHTLSRSPNEYAATPARLAGSHVESTAFHDDAKSRYDRSVEVDDGGNSCNVMVEASTDAATGARGAEGTPSVVTVSVG